MFYKGLLQLLILSLFFFNVDKLNFSEIGAKVKSPELPLGSKEVTMIAFVDISNDIEAKALSRAIVNHAISMLDQYQLQKEKLELIIVDNSFLSTGKKTKKEDLLNYKYDLNTDFRVSVFSNENGEISKYYKVYKSGTLIIMNDKTKEIKRWVGEFNPGSLAIEIEKTLNLDLHFKQ